MYDQATNTEPEERKPPGVRATPTWKWNFKPTVDEVKTFLNTPTPLPIIDGSSVSVPRLFELGRDGRRERVDATPHPPVIS